MNLKVLKAIFPVILLLFVCSCNKEYLETSPSDQIDQKKIFENISNVNVALNGVYRGLYRQYSDQEEDGHPAIMINMDFLGEDIVHTARGSSYFRNTYRWIGHISEVNDLVYFAYRLYFTTIANVNLILDGIDKVPGATEAQKNAIKGECYALRGWSYFNLVQLYGQRYDNANKPNIQLGVPIFTSYSLEPKARSTVEEVYQQINDDLGLAMTLLQNAPARANKTHIDLQVTKGIKARVALTMQNYPEAVTYAAEARAGYSLMSNSDYLSGFNSLRNGEWMWGANQLADQLPNFGAFYSYMSGNVNSVHTRTNVKIINSQLYAAIRPTDIRKKLWWDGTVADAINFPGVINVAQGGPEPSQMRSIYMHRKYMAADPSVSVGDIPFMRAAEMYLIEAEAKAALNLGADASDALVVLMRNRDPFYAKPTTISVTDVLLQRRIELWGEGFRFLDLKRGNFPLNRRNTGANRTLANWIGITAGDRRWQFMIPRREIQNNPFMIQNPSN
jgi:hypothetical protein